MSITIPNVFDIVELAAARLGLDIALFVHLYLADMTHFGAANTTYCRYLPAVSPSARACVQAQLPPSCPVMLEVLLPSSVQGALPLHLPPPSSPPPASVDMTPSLVSAAPSSVLIASSAAFSLAFWGALLACACCFLLLAAVNGEEVHGTGSGGGGEGGSDEGKGVDWCVAHRKLYVQPNIICT